MCCMTWYTNTEVYWSWAYHIDLILWSMCVCVCVWALDLVVSATSAAIANWLVIKGQISLVA
jgi:hypothetical protein